MRLRPILVSPGIAAAYLAAVLLFVSGCKAKPAATVKEANALDAKSAEAPHPAEDQRFKDFFDHVNAYVKIHHTADAKVPSLKETSDPQQLSGREKALADEIRIERAGAQQGNVFSASAAKEIGEIVAEDFNRRPLSDQKAILIEVPVKVPPAINTDYPTTLPLATMPPALLQKLPTLPEELEYRFLGRHLILRDISANLIVDFIPDAIPAAPAKTAGRGAHS